MNLGSIIFICKVYYLQCYSFRLNSTIFYFHLSPKRKKWFLWGYKNEFEYEYVKEVIEYMTKREYID